MSKKQLPLVAPPRKLAAHPFADVFPMMNTHERAELEDSLRARGFDPSSPIVLYKDKILDGRNRYAAAMSLDITPVFISPPFASDDEALAFVLGHNLARRHLTTSQRAMVAATLVTSAHGGKRWHAVDDQAAPVPLVSQYLAAKKLGVSERTVRAALKIRKDAPELIDAINAGTLTVKEAESQVRGPKPTKAHVAHATGEQDWWTPTEIIESARKVLGRIDFDPASSAAANARVGARVYFDKDADGRKQIWKGRGLLNPPFDQMDAFVDRLLELLTPPPGRKSAPVTAAIVVCNNATETLWCQALLRASSAVCFPARRLKFVRPDGTPSKQPLQGQALFYLGQEPRRFCEEFRKHGATGAIVAYSGGKAVTPRRKASGTGAA